MSGSTDHFSSVADQYANARPTYPPELYQWLAGLCPHRDLVWDVGCGNGQASAALATHFSQVIATDLSAQQIAAAPKVANITYRVAAAEAGGLAPESADLITIAQALHWFNLEAFYAEVRRVAKPDGIIAAWTYGKFEIDDKPVSAAVGHFYEHVIGPYWPPERIYPETGYASLSFPFERITAPGLMMSVDWTLKQMLGYFRSWSAVARYQKATGNDPVALIETKLKALWGDAEAPKRIIWPLSVLAARVHG